MSLTSIILAVALVSTGAPATSAELVLEADRARERGDLVESLRLVREAYALDPSPALLNNIGVLLEALGSYREAAGAFREVIADPRTPEPLRALDRRRLEALAPRLERAWIVAVVQPQDATLLAGGEALARDRELDLPAGKHAIEMYLLSAGEVVLRFENLAAGERTSFVEDLTKAHPDDGWIVLEGASPPITAIAVDGYRLRAPIFSKTKIIRLKRGARKLSVWRSDGAPITVDLELEAGETLALGRHPKLAPPVASPSVPVAPAVVASAEPQRDAGPWPWIVLGAGVAALGGGGALSFSASADRDEISSATRDMRGVITSVTFRRAGELEENANTKANAGAVLAFSGATMIATGLVWWLLENHVAD